MEQLTNLNPTVIFYKGLYAFQESTFITNNSIHNMDNFLTQKIGSARFVFETLKHSLHLCFYKM
jgi:hypothetical protein